MSENIFWLLRDIRKARKQGPEAIKERQRKRLSEMVAYARANSPYYRELYQGLPESIEDPTLLPVTDKKKLIARFDEWATDREVTLDKAQTWMGDPSLVGGQFLDKYLVATTSGTSGTRGIFVMDDRALSVDSVLNLRIYADSLSPRDVLRILAGRVRTAVVTATGGHFVGASIASRARQSKLGANVQIFSVHTPLPELVAVLNQFRPVIVGGYATVIAMLASEQEARRLLIHPALVQLGAEGLANAEYSRIAAAFHATVNNKYACAECPFISYSCSEGWLHVNADWVILEPVDADYQPVPPGTQSYTVLLSNLANRVQPILRYDLGDRIVQRPEPCPCGNPLQAIRVQGRTGDVLRFPTAAGEPVAIPSLVLDMLVEGISGIEISQIVQTSPTNLRVRLRLEASADPDRVWQAVRTEINQLLIKHKLDHVTVERATEPPEQSPGGKYRTVIPLSKSNHK